MTSNPHSDLKPKKMRLHDPTQIVFWIKARVGNKVRMITVVDTTVSDAIKELKELFENNPINVKSTERPASCQISVLKKERSKTLESKAFTIYGWTPEKAIELIINKIIQ